MAGVARPRGRGRLSLNDSPGLQEEEEVSKVIRHIGRRHSRHYRALILFLVSGGLSIASFRPSQCRPSCR